jgi:hypothetical protein
LLLAGDWLRVVCCGRIAWLAVHATIVQAASQPDCTGILLGALQCCLQVADLAQMAAAAGAAAVAFSDLMHMWWGAACTVAVCCGSAAVYGLSALARCKVEW